MTDDYTYKIASLAHQDGEKVLMLAVSTGTYTIDGEPVSEAQAHWFIGNCAALEKRNGGIPEAVAPQSAEIDLSTGLLPNSSKSLHPGLKAKIGKRAISVDDAMRAGREHAADNDLAQRIQAVFARGYHHGTLRVPELPEAERDWMRDGEHRSNTEAHEGLEQMRRSEVAAMIRDVRAADRETIVNARTVAVRLRNNSETWKLEQQSLAHGADEMLDILGDPR